jgi:hypothetical protein
MPGGIIHAGSAHDDLSAGNLSSGIAQSLTIYCSAHKQMKYLPGILIVPSICCLWAILDVFFTWIVKLSHYHYVGIGVVVDGALYFGATTSIGV